MLEPGEKVYAIGVGDAEDVKAERASLYYVEGEHGEKGLPVFTSREKLFGYVEDNFHTPEAHLSFLDRIDLKGVEPLTEGRFSAVTLDSMGVASVVASIEADYIIRDPRPGDQQEILRFPK
jgi:hypothetical protein